MITKKIKDEIWQAAEQSYPQEMCGFIVAKKRKSKFIQCANISPELNSFIMDPRGIINAEEQGKLIMIVHSHCNESAQPSQSDEVGCELSGIPWLIVSLPTRQTYEWKPKGYEAPLEGRKFSHGVLDCYTLLKDFYSKELNISIPDFHRDYAWWKKGANLYLENFGKAGFVKVDDQKIHDVVLMQMDSPVPNHAGILLDKNQFIHHLEGHLSCKQVYGGFWRKNTWCTLRHKELL
jgi:proteasome lid subunit RPN8/RPN11